MNSPMKPVAAKKEGNTAVQVLASGTNPEPSYSFRQEPDGLPTPPTMQPFGENVDTFGYGGQPGLPQPAKHPQWY